MGGEEGWLTRVLGYAWYGCDVGRVVLLLLLLRVAGQALGGGVRRYVWAWWGLILVVMVRRIRTVCLGLYQRGSRVLERLRRRRESLVASIWLILRAQRSQLKKLRRGREWRTLDVVVRSAVEAGLG